MFVFILKKLSHVGEGDAGIIPLQDFFIAVPLSGKRIGAVLAHADPVPVTVCGHNDAFVRYLNVHCGRTQAKQIAKRCAASVSYTHLDVYKRQTLW